MPTKPIPVLLIEDNRGDARLIREMLAEAGDVRFELTEVPALDDGLAALDGGGPAVVLLDLSLPDSQGLDTFRRLRTHHARPPVVVLTGLDDTALAQQAVSEGAQDYLVKGRVTAAHLVHALRHAVGRHQAQAALARAHRATEQELLAARDIQQRLFPHYSPRAPHLDIHGASFPAVATGGDFFDYLPLPHGQLGLVIADVMSHGLGPALLMATTRAYLRAFGQTARDIGGILASTNALLSQDVGEHFVTLLLAQLCPRTLALRHTSAGHCPGCVLGPRGEVRHELLSTDMALGIWPGACFKPAPAVALEPGDVLFLYTDGVVEARSGDGEPFGRERALELLRRHRAESAERLVGRLHTAIRSWEGDGPQGDDQTAMIIKVLSEAR